MLKNFNERFIILNSGVWKELPSHRRKKVGENEGYGVTTYIYLDLLR